MTENKLHIPILKLNEQAFIKCIGCGGAVELYEDVQKALATGGGLGHKCSTCNKRYIIVYCDNCCTYLAVDDKEWDGALKNRKLQCTNCNLQLMLSTKTAMISMSSIMMHHAVNKSDTNEAENKYLGILEKSKTEEKLTRILQMHGTIKSRLKSAKYELEELKSKGVTGPTIFNNPECIDTHQHDLCDAEDIAFKVCNSLISCLEIATQEVVAVLNIDWSEKNISFGRLGKNRKFSQNYPDIQRAFDEFRVNKTYTYLSSLRNCIHHRSSVPISIKSTFTIQTPGPIIERSELGEHILYLPDDPEKSVSELSFDMKLELDEVLRSTLLNIEKFLDQIYSLLYKSLTIVKQ